MESLPRLYIEFTRIYTNVQSAFNSHGIIYVRTTTKTTFHRISREFALNFNFLPHKEYKKKSYEWYTQNIHMWIQQQRRQQVVIKTTTTTTTTTINIKLFHHYDFRLSTSLDIDHICALSINFQNHSTMLTFEVKTPQSIYHYANEWQEEYSFFLSVDM